MSEPRAQRTLVKSPPELWSELSDIDSLARHLGEFGEIRITRLEPETTVAWEGDRARGTVHLEPSGWGTKVTLTAELAEPGPEPEPVAAEPEPEPVAAEPEPEPVAAEPEPEPEPEPVAAEPEPEPAPAAEPPKPGFFARLFGRRPRPEAVVVKAAPREEAAPEALEPLPPPQTAAAVPVVDEPVAAEPEPVVAEEPAPEPEPDAAALDGERAQAILAGVLDDLGSAHHRPFSRG